jgi:hypothetical protein
MPLKKNQRIVGSLSLSLLLVVTSLRLADVRAEEQEAHTGILKNWDIYGSVRLEGAYWIRYKGYDKLDSSQASKLDFDKLKSDGYIGKRGGKDSVLLDTVPIKSLRMGLQNNSYFGVRGKGDKFGFCFEMGLGSFLQGVGLGGTDQDQLSELYLTSNKRQSTMLRKIYGDWYINDYATLRIGQDWNIANFFISDQVFNSDAGLGYSGVLYTGRRPQVKLMGSGKTNSQFNWKAEAAVIKQDVYTVGSMNLKSKTANPEEKLPKFEFGGEIGYKISDLIKLKTKVVGGFTQYDLVIYKEDFSADPSVTSDIRAKVKSNLLAINANLDIWKVSTRFSYAQGQNLATYGVWMGNPDASLTDEGMRMFMPSYSETGDTTGAGLGYPNGNPTGSPPRDILNANTRQGGLVVHVDALSWLGVEAGAGKIIADHDDPTIMTNAKQKVNGLDRWAFYTNLQFTTAGGHFLIVPEYSYSDFGGFPKKGSDEGGGIWESYGLKLELDI